MNELGLTVIGLLALVAVGVWAMKNLKPEGVLKVASEQLAQARVQAIKHRAAAEEHAALADMYEVRQQRLEAAGVGE